MTSDEINSADVGGWASSGTVDRVGQYARSGRKHQRLTDEELTANWVVAIERLLANNIANPNLRADEDELRSELTLRKMEPLFEHPGFKQYVVEVSKLLEAIEHNDPAQYLEMIGDMGDDVGEFKSGRDREQN